MSTANLGLPISRYFLCAWLGSALRFQSSHCCYQREGVHILCTVGYLAVSLVVTAHSCPSSVMNKNVFRWYLVFPGRQITPLRTSVKVTSLPHQRWTSEPRWNIKHLCCRVLFELRDPWLLIGCGGWILRILAVSLLSNHRCPALSLLSPFNIF